MKILVVSAHPDDEIIGMGGTLQKLSKNHEIDVLFLADGITARKQGGHTNAVRYETTALQEKEMKQEINIRKKHAKNALAKVGVKKCTFLDLPDNELDTVPFLKIVKHIENEIKHIKPNIIFTHHYNDLNIDHRRAYEASITASRPIFDSRISSIISFEAISSTDWNFPYRFNPTLFVDISSELKSKVRAISEYKNELRDFPHPRSVKAITSNAERWGSLSGFKAAEAFEIIRSRVKNSKDFALFDNLR
jgi:LmbE family N-acetylglucosaminyl deacetylase